jgi:hypothetical protein
MRIIVTGSDLSSRDIMTGDPSSSHRDLSDLAEVGNAGSCEDLMRRDISIHAVESDILRDHSLELCHEWYEEIVLIGDKFSPFPHLGEFRVRSDDERVDLELIWTKIRILKYLSHRTAVEIWCRADESRHHVSHHLESCILE